MCRRPTDRANPLSWSPQALLRLSGGCGFERISVLTWIRVLRTVTDDARSTVQACLMVSEQKSIIGKPNLAGSGRSTRKLITPASLILSSPDWTVARATPKTPRGLQELVTSMGKTRRAVVVHR